MNSRNAFQLTIVNCQLSIGQNILLKEDVNADTIPQTLGPNLKHFRHLYLGYNFALDDSKGKGATIDHFASFDYCVGFRYKRKISRHYAMGLDVYYHKTSYALKQDSTKMLPDKNLHHTERMIFNNFGLGYFNRINIGRSGNFMGRYLDLGFDVDWTYRLVHYTSDNAPNGNVIQTKIRGLNYYHSYNYGLYARFGYNRYVISAGYRLSDLFIKSANYPELPRLTAGVQLGLH